MPELTRRGRSLTSFRSRVSKSVQQLELLSNACAEPCWKKVRTSREKSTPPVPPKEK